ncbi:hypothetical protein GCM10027080_07380 [Pedococcus soli]
MVSPASTLRRARAVSACAAIALLAVPATAHAAPRADPDARAGKATTRDVGPDAGPVPSPVTAAAAPTTDRLAGADRYATAAAASRAAFPSANPAGLTTVYLASGADYADALAAGPTAVARGGGLLLTQPDRLTASTATELRRLAPDRVVVVGGAGAVSARAMRDVSALGLPVSRISGADRYATSAAVAREGFPSGARTAWVATGQGYADALSAGPAASAAGGPVVLVDGRSRTLPAATSQLLKDLGVTTVRIAGGTGVVSSGIESGLRSLVGSSAVTRSAGADRYTTTIAVNSRAFPSLSRGDAYVAAGNGFADALAVGVLAGRSKRPLYLSYAYCANGSVRTELSRTAISRVRLVGGPGAIRGYVGTLGTCRSLTAADSLWVVANKQRRLSPKSYAPSGLVQPDVATINGHKLRRDAAAALKTMIDAARAEGAGRIALLSGYRSYSYQVQVYNAEVALRGVAAADKVVARPGYSEHQTGLGMDLSPVGDPSCNDYRCIGNTPQGRWLAANAPRFGFVLRYESGRTPTTGYSPEPWHFRYLGAATSRDYKAGGFHTIEDYFGLPAAPRY